MSGHPWRKELASDVGTVRAVLAEQFPELAAGEIRYLHEGWDSVAYEVDGIWIFRFPKRREVERFLAVERLLLPELARRLPVAVPLFRFLGSPSRLFPASFAGYRKIEGCFASELPPERTDRVTVARQLGEFLSALHDVPLDPFLAHGLPEEPGDLSEYDGMRAAAMEGLPSLQVRLGDPLLDRARRFLERSALPDASPLPPVLLHDDLVPEHILLAEDGSAVRGIIDWGDAAAGDPAVDFVGVMEWGGDDAVAEVLSSYRRPVDPAFLERTRYRAVCVAVGDVRYGLESGSTAHVRFGLDALGRALGGSVHG